MARIPDGKKVSKALGAADKAIKACLHAVNQDAAKRMGRGDYAGAQNLASIGTEVQNFRREVEALRGKWNAIGGTSEQTGGNNTTTPLWAYYQPILQALANLGGEARRADIEPQVEQLMKPRFQAGDCEPVSHGRNRWQSMIRKAHRHLVKEGWIEDRMGKVWKITPAGRQAAKAEVSSSGLQKQ